MSDYKRAYEYLIRSLKSQAESIEEMAQWWQERADTARSEYEQTGDQYSKESIKDRQHQADIHSSDARLLRSMIEHATSVANAHEPCVRCGEHFPADDMYVMEDRGGDLEDFCQTCFDNERSYSK